MARKSIRGLGANLYAPPTDHNEHQLTSGPVHQHTGDETSQAKATFYLSPETLDHLDRTWLDRRRGDRRISKSSLVEQALREFLSKTAAA